MPKSAPTPTFSVTDGELVLQLQPAEDGWYAVTSPVEPHLHTQAKSIEEAFEMARDALEGLAEVRAQYRDAIDSAMNASA